MGRGGLQVWYAAHYAERMGLQAHELTEEDLALMDEQASRFQCSACSRRFRTSMALQRHLLEHEREEVAMEEEKAEEEGGEEEEGTRKGRRRAAGQAKNHLLKAKAKQVGWRFGDGGRGGEGGLSLIHISEPTRLA